MFTKRELAIMRSALVQWKGPFREGLKLIEKLKELSKADYREVA